MPDFASFAAKLGLKFENQALLIEALTHRSYLNENRGTVSKHNERLEFLGDAVLELAVTHFLYFQYPNKQEGELTAYRAALVNTVSLASLAEKLGVNDYLLLSKGEAKDTGRARAIILANAFEALLGAVYLDQGYEAAEKFLALNLYPRLAGVLEQGTWQDAKSRFQEASQEHRGVTPTYRTISETGPDHARSFTVGVFLHAEEIGRGEGKSKQEAEQAAAQNGIDKMGW
ncbi:MAG: ribonuclease III [bacterium]